MDEKDRIEKIMESEGMNATQFALEIGIQGSTLSHILNGRNKPSLDVIKRVLNRFRTINSDWLMLGIGAMYRSGGQAQQSFPFDIKPQSPDTSSENNMEAYPEEFRKPVSDIKEKQYAEAQKSKTTVPPKTITRIVVFYSDNSFDELIKQQMEQSGGVLK